MKAQFDEAPAHAANPLSPSSAAWILAATILGSSMGFIDGTVVNVALPALQASLHATVVDVQWVVESYGLFLSALILVGGALGDSIGRRLTFLTGVIIFTAASIACALSSTVGQLIAWRCLQGFGAAFLVPSSLAIISAAFDEKSRGRAIGTWSGFTAITTALGPVLGGWLVEHASWHWVFYINVPLAAAVIVISLRHIPETRSADASKIDWLGAALVTIGLGGLIYGFIESATLGWHHAFVIGSLTGGILALIAFVFVEMRSQSPMVPLHLFQSSKFAGANLLTLFLYSALGVFFFLFPMNLIQVQHYSATATGAATLPAILLMFLLSRWSGGLVARYGPRPPLIIGPLIAAAGFLLFAWPSVGGHYWTTFFPGFVVFGIGTSVSVAPLTTVVMSSVAQDHAGTASGINNAVARVAGVLAIAVLGVVAVAAFSHHLQHSLASLQLPPDILHSLQANAIRLAALEVPGGVSGDISSQIHSAIANAFVSAFRLIMMICAGLSVASAAVAWREI